MCFINPCHNLYDSAILSKIGSRNVEGGGVKSHMEINRGLIFEKIISVENLLLAWRKFIRDKRDKPDVQIFDNHFIDNILQLHSDLANKIYKHGGYYRFNISDPKPRNISKAQVRDRLVHHAIYRILYPFFDKIFIFDSYSCRVRKGAYKAIDRFNTMFWKVSRNSTRTCWVLKMDIKKFFASIDHRILKNILAKYILDQDILWLLGNIIDSFEPGLPLGNLTSQLLVNIYMNELDQFVKHKLKIKYYIRYADDFVILSHNKLELINQRAIIDKFLQTKLFLWLHPNKVSIKTFASGVDFLGWVNFPTHRVLRTATKRRMFRRIKERPTSETLQSYLGLINHGNSYKLKEILINN
jgi:RNA-directed DNA polymerase